MATGECAVNSWREDDDQEGGSYWLHLYQEGADEVAEFFLIERKKDHPDRDVTGDTDAYARRIKALKEGADQ